MPTGSGGPTRAGTFCICRVIGVSLARPAAAALAVRPRPEIPPYSPERRHPKATIAGELISLLPSAPDEDQRQQNNDGHGAGDPPPRRRRADPVLHLDPANPIRRRVEIVGLRYPEILQFLKRAIIRKYRRQVFRKVLEEISGILSKPKISVWITLPIGRQQQCWLPIIIENAEIGFCWYCQVKSESCWIFSPGLHPLKAVF